MMAVLLLLLAPAMAKVTGLAGASLCCGSTCHRLHEESPRAWERQASLQHPQTLPRVQ
jgi:hypothetical protein